MFKMRILIVLIMLIICSIQDMRTGYINVAIPIISVLLYFMSLLAMYIVTGTVPDYLKSGIGGILALALGLFSIIKRSVCLVIKKDKSNGYESQDCLRIGEGDLYVAIALLAILGIEESFRILFYSFILAGIYALFLKTVKKENSSTGFPFVPFMMGGFIMNIMKKGSLTIELSLLMPGILAVLILIIYMGYYIHDKCVVQRAAYTSACALSSGSKSVHDGTTMSESRLMPDKGTILDSGTLWGGLAEDEFNRLFEENTESLIGNWDISKDICVSDGEINIHVRGTMRCLNGVLSRYLSNLFFSVNIKEIVSLESGPDFIRKRHK